MKNSTDTIGNRTRDLPACSVPQPTAAPRAPGFDPITINVSLLQRVRTGFRAHPPRVKRPDRKAAIHVHLMPRLRMRGAISPLLHMLLWSGAYLSRGTSFNFLG
jgi:hypothetical protein